MGGRQVIGRLLRRLPVVLAVAAIVFGWIGLNLEGIYFRDTLAYWRPDMNDLYGDRQVGIMSTYLYAPAFAQAVAPLGLLPWPAFAAFWSALNLIALVWMVGPVLAAILFFLPGSPVADEISTGNIHLLLAAGVVLGFRYPGVWSFALLTKISPGVGVLWFLGRREWRPFLMALATTAVIVAVSFVLAPAAWFEWFDLLRRSSGVPVPAEIGVIPGPLWARALAGAALAIGAGMMDRRWILPVAVTLALPVPWSSGLSLLVAVIPLTRPAWRPVLERAWDRLSSRLGPTPGTP
jgi:hypothetical protein